MTSTSRYHDDLRGHYATAWLRPGRPEAWESGPVDELPTGFSVLVFDPTPERTLWTHATCGMSAPDGGDGLELHVFAQRPARELVELLYAVVHYHATVHRLGLHHTVNFGRPWLPGSRCQHGLVSLPFLDGPALEKWRFDGRDVRCLWLIPITAAELAYKREHGANALEERFEAERLDYANPARVSTV